MSDTVITHMSEPLRRLEIFIGAGKQRTWRASIMVESSGGSKSVSAVARRHGMTPPHLFARRRQAKGRTVMAKERLSFAAVVVNSAPIEIGYGGTVIRMPAGSDAATMRAVL